MTSTNLRYTTEDSQVQEPNKAPNKDKLYGKFYSSVERKNKLHDLAVTQALDLPVDDELNIDQTNSRNTVNHHYHKKGSSTWLLGVLIPLSLMAGMLFSLFMTQLFSSKEEVNKRTEEIIVKEKKEGQLVIRDPDGNIISLPKWTPQQ